MASCSAIDCSLPLIILLWLTHGLPKHVYIWYVTFKLDGLFCLAKKFRIRGISTHKIKHSWIMNCKSLENKVGGRGGGEPFFNTMSP